MAPKTDSQRKRELYLEAIRIQDLDERQRFLDERCAGEPQLRSGLVKLLNANAPQVPNPLGEAVTSETNLSTPEAMGIYRESFEVEESIDISTHPMIGRYKLLEQIGHGGMGTVYMAQQSEPVKRKVALKVIKPGMDTREVIARFEAERQALALMDHPNIARVLDGGSTDEGRPYFVMELVRGVPITQFCERKNMSLRERLELFVDVCKAVQHAHQKGIIHRDLKPSNIMITLRDGVPVVKVIDFGVAKALSQQLTDKTLYTHYSQVVGTPLYMAPEQAEMSCLDVDTRSDIYSLGVVLYELLTGTTPFDRETLSSLGIDGIRKLLQDQEPPRPSVRVSTLRQAHQSTIEDQRELDTKDISNQLKRELDWIVMKALEKDRDRRYETANAFAADVKRYLNDEPVKACPPSQWYLLTKYVKKNKGLLTTSLIIVSMLLISSFVSTGFAILASQARSDAEASEKNANDALADSRKSEAEAVKQARIARSEASRADQAAVLAEAAKVREEIERRRAETALYVSDTRLAAAHSRADERADALTLLLDHLPNPERQDSRGWEWYYLLDQSNQAVVSWQASSTNIAAVDWSPDGSQIATVHWDGFGARIWNADNGSPIRDLQGGRMLHVGIDWHPSGDMLAWGSVADDSHIRIWDATNDQITTISANTGSHRRVRWSPDGKLLALATINDTEPSPTDEGYTLAVWEKTADGFEMLKRKKTGSSIDKLEWSPTGDKFAIISGKRAIIVDPVTLEFTMPLPQKHVTSINWHPTESILGLGTTFGAVLIVDPKTHEELTRFDAHTGDIRTIAWSPNGRFLGSGGEDRVVHIWDFENQVPVSRYVGHDAMINEISWHPGSDRLASCGRDGRINVWPIQKKRERLEIENRYEQRVAQAGSTAQRFAWVDDETIRSVANRKEITDFNIRSGEQSIVGKIEAKLEGRMASVNAAFAVDHDLWKHRQVPIVLMENGRIRRSLTLENAGVIWATGSNGSEVAFQTAPTGDLYFINLENNSRLRLGQQNHFHITELIRSPDQKLIAAVGMGVQSDDGTPKYAGWLHMFDAASGKKLGRVRVGHRRIGALAGDWRPDGKYIVATTHDGVCQIYDAATLATKLYRRFHSLEVTSVSWHPAEPRIAYGSVDGSLVVWDAESGDVLMKFALDSPIAQVKWSPNGELLAAGNYSGKVVVWDATHGYEYAQSEAFERSVMDRLKSQLSHALKVSDFAMALETAEKLKNADQSIEVSSLYRLALLSLSLQELMAYSSYCEQAVEQFTSSKSPFETHFTSWMCALAPDALEDYKPAIQLARHAVQQFPGNQQYLDGLGAILVRAGQYDAAKEYLNKALKAGENDNTSPSYIHYFLAMTEHHLGNADAAKVNLAKANASAEKEHSESPAWNRRLTLELLRKESEALILGPNSAPND